MKFLAVNELLLRGSLESTHDDQDVSAGLFLKLVEYTLAKDPKLTNLQVFLKMQNTHPKTYKMK